MKYGWSNIKLSSRPGDLMFNAILLQTRAGISTNRGAPGSGTPTATSYLRLYGRDDTPFDS
jgi:hypothetical protein